MKKSILYLLAGLLPKAFGLFLFTSFVPMHAEPKVREYHLKVHPEAVTVSEKTSMGMAINGSIPGPVLTFREGEIARIHVENEMNVETSIHWHGLLLPNREDGVPYLTTPPILPHGTYTYEFPLKQAGTYWYHSHTALQEQRGVYGAIVIEPHETDHESDLDEVVVLSDWTHEKGKTVMRTLKRGSEFYSFKKKQNQHLLGALKRKALTDYLKRSWDRMLPMDISDVAYDAFLSNGKKAHQIYAEPGQVVRLRLVNAGAASYFYVQFSGGPMKVIASDGLNVEPFDVDRLLMAIAETYDVLVTVPESGRFELRATAQDGSGFTSTFLGSGADKVTAQIVPRPNLYKIHSSHVHGKMSGHHMHHRPQKVQPRPGTPYDQMKASSSTAFSEDREWREVHLNLTGDMERYIWSFNNKVLHEEDKIEIQKGENVRFILENKTMMHHPIHLHGHFFRVVNRHGAYSPLKHTVDVPPMGKRVIEFEATEDKGWLFHCHVLYHMKGGMTRVVHYKGSEPHEDLLPFKSKLLQNPWYFWGNAHLLSQMTEGQVRASNTRNDVIINWQNNYLQDYEAEAFYQRYFNRMFKAFAGLFSSDEDRMKGIFGFSYILPFLIEARAWVDTGADVRISASQDIPITRHFAAKGEVEYDTGTKWEWSAGGEMYLHRAISLVGQYHSEYGAGGGIDVRF